MDHLLVERVRQGEAEAWRELIALFEGRLLAFVEARIGDRTSAEDVVQETFLGFLISLPNYDPATPVESFLFSIAAHKLTDLLRRRGRRPALPLIFPDQDGEGSSAEPAGRARRPSSLARSQERRGTEEQVLGRALGELIAGWSIRGDFEKLKCLELLFVLGWSNKEVASRLGLSEQTVANHKHYAITQIKSAVTRARLRDVDLKSYGIDEG